VFQAQLGTTLQSCLPLCQVVYSAQSSIRLNHAAGRSPLQVVVGRLPTSSLPILDQEISGRHIVIKYEAIESLWKVMDAGSLNGSVLNGKPISHTDRRPGQLFALSDGDLLELGEVTKIKVACGVEATLPPSKRRAPAGESCVVCIIYSMGPMH